MKNLLIGAGLALVAIPATAATFTTPPVASGGGGSGSVTNVEPEFAVLYSTTGNGTNSHPGQVVYNSTGPSTNMTAGSSTITVMSDGYFNVYASFSLRSDTNTLFDIQIYTNDVEHTAFESTHSWLGEPDFSETQIAMSTYGIIYATSNTTVKVFVDWSAGVTADVDFFDGQFIVQKVSGIGSAGGAGSGTPAGADTMVQFNDGGSFGGLSNLVYFKATGETAFTNQFGAGHVRFRGPVTLHDKQTNTAPVRIESSLNVTGAATNQSLRVNGAINADGNIVGDGGTSISGIFSLTSASIISTGNGTIQGNTTLGDGSTDLLTLNGHEYRVLNNAGSSVITPATSGSYSLVTLGVNTNMTANLAPSTNCVVLVQQNGTGGFSFSLNGVSQQVRQSANDETECVIWRGLNGSTNISCEVFNSAGLAAGLDDETGTGAAVFGTSPTITSPSLTLDGNTYPSDFDTISNGQLLGFHVDGANLAITNLTGGGGSGDITSVGDVSSGAAFDGTAGTTLQFEGATADGFEVSLTSQDPAADVTVTLPAATGDVPVIVHRDGTITGVTNSTTEADLLNYTIPASMLGTEKSLEVNMGGVVSTQAGSPTNQITVYLGGTVIFQKFMTLLSAGNRPWTMRFTLTANDSETAQSLNGMMMSGVDSGTGTGLGDFGTDEIIGNSVMQARSTIGTSTNVVLRVTTQQYTASTTHYMDRDTLTVTLK